MTQRPTISQPLRIGTLIFIVVSFLGQQLLAQQNGAANAQPQDDGFVDLKVAKGEPINIEGLIKTLQADEGMQIYYDPDAFPAESKIMFFGDVKIRAGEQYFQFVQLVLRNSEYAIVQSDIEGMHRIVPLSNVRPFAPRRNATDVDDLKEGLENGQYVTAVFSLKYITPETAENYLKEFVLRAASGGNQSQPTNRNEASGIDGIITTLAPNLLIITEMASRINRIKEAIETIDVPQAKIKTVFQAVINLEASALEQQLTSILQQQDSIQGQLDRPASPDGNTTTTMQDLKNIKISSDERTNRLILIGTGAAIERVQGLIEELDQRLDLDVRTFQFQHISAGRVDALIRQSLPSEASQLERFYQSTINEGINSLIVTARADILGRIEELRDQLDIPGSNFEASSPVMFYKLKHVKAADILGTLQRVSRQYFPEDVRNAGQFNRGQNSRLNINTETGIRNIPGRGPSGGNVPNFRRDGQSPLPPVVRDNLYDPNSPFANQGLDGSGYIPGNQYSPLPNQLNNSFQNTENVLPGDAQITVDENTNTLIVVAEPAIQQLYKELIEKLDIYRPQVLVEVTVVSIDAQEDFNLGVEISGGDRRGDKRLFSFTSFGLSEDIDATTGALTISPGLGFNGSLVDPDVADVVLRALSRHRRAKVISAPRILVNDNATGLLSSVAEVPFASINASQTVATTSFAGFATAGTTVSVTPHISEGDYLNLEFDVLVNDFTGTGNESLPPPRNTDQVTSEISIPNGHTIIVGGLTRQRSSDETQAVPFLEEIPIFKFLTSNNSDGSREQRLFVFIKPIILTDDKFKDLRYLSEIDQREACIPGDYPKSEPLLIR